MPSSIRKRTRKLLPADTVPAAFCAALLRAHLKLAERDFLATNPGYTRVPKQKREELRDAVRSALLARTLPVPSVVDAVWDTANGVLTLASLTAKAVEQFESALERARKQVHLASMDLPGSNEQATSGRRFLSVVRDGPAAAKPMERLVVRSGGRVFFLRTEEIDWIEAASSSLISWFARMRIFWS